MHYLRPPRPSWTWFMFDSIGIANVGPPKWLGNKQKGALRRSKAVDKIEGVRLLIEEMVRITNLKREARVAD